MYGRIHGLAVGLLEGALSDAQRQELESLLLDDPAARRAYLEHMQESACLRGCASRKSARRCDTLADSRPASRRRLVAESHPHCACWAAGFGAGFCHWIAVYRSPNSHDAKTKSHRGCERSEPAERIAESACTGRCCRRTEPPRRRDDHGGSELLNGIARRVRPNVLSRWAVGDRLKLRSGSAELTFDAGAQVTVFGPADFEITSRHLDSLHPRPDHDVGR